MSEVATREQLTRAETAVLDLVAEGLSTGDVAARLAITVGTVKCHLHHAFAKLEVRNRIEAVAKAYPQT